MYGSTRIGGLLCFKFCIVYYVVFISFYGSHSDITIWEYGIVSGGGIDLVSLFWIEVKCVSMIFL